MVCLSNFGQGLHEHIATNIGFFEQLDGSGGGGGSSSKSHSHDESATVDDDVLLLVHVGGCEMRARKMNLAD